MKKTVITVALLLVGGFYVMLGMVQITVAHRPVKSAFVPDATVKDISTDLAMQMLASARAAATARGLAMDIAIVDTGGNMKAFVRMDGAWLGSIDIAMKKARTARGFDMPTEEIGKLSQPGKPLYGIEVSNGGLITFPGGLPVKNSAGLVIGAIGVSGSTVENDEAIAQAGVALD